MVAKAHVCRDIEHILHCIHISILLCHSGWAMCNFYRKYKCWTKFNVPMFGAQHTSKGARSSWRALEAERWSHWSYCALDTIYAYFCATVGAKYENIFLQSIECKPNLKVSTFPTPPYRSHLKITGSNRAREASSVLRTHKY